MIIYVKPTDSCNLDCNHCFTGGSKAPKTKWDVVSTVKWISDLAAIKSPNSLHIELHGGEPFIVPLEEHVSFATNLKSSLPNDISFTLGATTNLVYKLTDDHISFIKEHLGSRIATSYDPVNRFKNYGMYSLWLSNIKRLSENGVKIKLFISVTKELLVIAPSDLLELISTFSVDEVSLERLTYDGNAIHNPRIFPTNEEIDRYYYDLYFAYKAASLPYKIATLDIIEDKFKTRKFNVDTNCRDCEQNLYTLNADGSIAGCANGASTEASGSVEESPVIYLESRIRTDRIVKEVNRDDRCYDCNLFDVCQGDCYRLPWQGSSCPGLRRLLTHFKYGNKIPVTEIR